MERRDSDLCQAGRGGVPQVAGDRGREEHSKRQRQTEDGDFVAFDLWGRAGAGGGLGLGSLVFWGGVVARAFFLSGIGGPRRLERANRCFCLCKLNFLCGLNFRAPTKVYGSFIKP